MSANKTVYNNIRNNYIIIILIPPARLVGEHVKKTLLSFIYTINKNIVLSEKR